jgi:hypothetical protein
MQMFLKRLYRSVLSTYGMTVRSIDALPRLLLFHRQPSAIREIKVLIETTSQTQAKKPTTVARSKDQGLRLEIVNNCVTTQDNEEGMEAVDCGGLDQSRHARHRCVGLWLRMGLTGS